MSTQPVLASDQHDNVLVVVPQGDTAGFRTGAIENDLKGILEKMKADDKPYVVVDLGKSRYFGSMVIGAVKTLTNMAREEIAKLQNAVGTDFELCLAKGDVADVTRDAAVQHNADLVIIGRGLIQHPLGRFRTHAYSIIRQAPCPVLSV